MVNSYGMNTYPQMNYNQGFNQNIQPQQNRSSGFGSVIGTAVVGGAVGGAIGYLKNRHPVDKNGVASDSFAKQAFENHVSKNMSSDGKEFFKQLKTVTKGLEKVKDVEGMKKLLNDNKKVFAVSGMSLDTYLSSLTPDNIQESKKVLQEQIEKRNMTNYQTFKNLTEKCWNKEKKCFTKPDEVEQKIFDVIKNTKTKGQWKKALKYGGVTAGVMGALTLGYKMMTSAS
ncbi:hypothetical protein EGQ24_02490 [bacterium]|nr:hypothetical protein [bacterium]